MADQPIGGLPTAGSSVNSSSTYFAVEQFGNAAKVTGATLMNETLAKVQDNTDPTPRKDSTNLITSGGVYDAMGGVFSPTKLATPGPLVHISDGAYNQPIQGMRIAINPVQSGEGDPSPDNVRPISGYQEVTVTRAGKNICTNIVETHTRAGVTLTRMSDGTLVFNGTATAEAVFYVSTRNGSSSMDSLVDIVPGEYTVSGCPEGGNAQTYYVRLYLFHDANYLGINFSETGSGKSFTVEAPANRYRVAIRIQNGQVCNNLTFKPQLEVGNTATAYEPYTAKEYDVTIPTAAGTVYGGTLTYNGDGTWTLEVDRAMRVFDGTEAWYLNGSGGAYRTPRGVIPASAQNCVCNMLRMSNTQGAPSGYGYVGTTSILVYLDSATADNLDSWKAYLAENNMQIVYPLASPQTFTLTGPEVLTLLGINNIWADCGDIEELAYRADIGLYLTEALNPIKEMLANREDTMKATRAYSAGDYIIVGDTFYRAATAIANGATLTPGTNVIKTTVGDQLKALS